MQGKVISVSSGDMAEERVDPEALLSRANEQEKEYDWIGAAESFQSALEMLPEDDSFSVGRIQEALAYALFRCAMQAEHVEEFKARLNETERQYERARQSLDKAASLASSPLMHRCEAMIACLRFWRAQDAATKRRNVGDAWTLAKKAIDGFERNEVSELAKTYNETFPSVFHSIFLSENQEFRVSTLREAIEYGEKVVRVLSDTEHRDELARALVYVAESLVSLNACSAVSSDEYDCNHNKAADSWRRAVALSEEAALVAKASADLVNGLGEILWNDFEDIAKRQLEYVRKTRDRYASGITLGILAFYYYYDSYSKETPEDTRARLDEALRYVEEATKEFGRIGCVDPSYQGFWVSSPTKWWYYYDMSLLETDLQAKHGLNKELLKFIQVELKSAEESGYSDAILSSLHHLSLTLTKLGGTETDRMEKARVLGEAVSNGKEEVRLGDILMPGDLWSRCLKYFSLGTAEMGFAEVTDNPESRKASIDSSVLHMREGLNLVASRLSLRSYWEIVDESSLMILSDLWRDYGRALRKKYALTNDREALVTSVTAFQKAAEFDEKAGQPSRVAESLWEVAQTYDDLGEYLKASERFGEASQQYGRAAERIKSLSLLYKDQSLYMQAWSEIDKARYHHARQEPSAAKEHYETAAEHHHATEKWNFLSANYSAWAQFENAEDLSQRESCRESIQAFRRAAELFKDSKRSMQELAVRIDSSAEKQMVEKLIDAADHREDFCKARIILEEARQLDKEGDLVSASEKYGLAAEAFAKIKQGIAAEQERREIELIVTLSMAWMAMAKAEAESLPELFEEAAHLFDKAKDIGPGSRAKNLCIGHSRLCMALASGARYADSGNAALHAAAAQNLESAAKYYLKADQKSAAEYAKASKLLFDGYVYMNKASSEENERTKAKLYSMAEKVLQASVSSYDKASQPGRKEQVLKLLTKVKEDRELAMSLAEVFLAPDIVSAAMAFSSPTPAYETAVGLDRFEHADIHAMLTAKPRELLVGQEIIIEFELVNAGRGTAQLMRIEEAAPKGFAVAQEPEKYRMDDSYVNMKGRRLDSLKTEDVRLVLRPAVKGNFKLKPRIVYLDESGAHRSCEPTPVEVAVKEMGILGWMKGT
jgi:hypothetical protein